MKVLQLKYADYPGDYCGFTLKKGFFYGVEVETGTPLATSGWESGDSVAIYARVDKKWRQNWYPIEDDDIKYQILNLPDTEGKLSFDELPQFVVKALQAEGNYNIKEDTTMKKIKNLNNINRVRFNDYTDYDSSKCNNGGRYGFWTDYDRLENGKWEVSYGTTADFTYCPVCGSFNNHDKGDDAIYESGYDCGDFETVTESELLDRINSFTETDDEYIEYK